MNIFQDRVTPAQKTRMVDLLSENFTYSFEMKKLVNRDAQSMTWEEIAEELNAMGGCVRSVVNWKKCWSDMKCDVQKKVLSAPATSRLLLNPEEYKIAVLYNLAAEETTNSDTEENPDEEITDTEVQIKFLCEDPEDYETELIEEGEEMETEELEQDESLSTLEKILQAQYQTNELLRILVERQDTFENTQRAMAEEIRTLQRLVKGKFSNEI